VQGVARIQIEWDVSSIQVEDSREIESATVVLNTLKGSVDELDTTFWVATEDQDGLLEVSDFETEATVLKGVVMPVPEEAQTGDEGTFSFSVLNELRAAIDQGFNFFSIQGRVDESLAGQGFKRGLQVRSTATGNLEVGKEPQLEVVILPPAPQLVWMISTLPTLGTLTDLSGSPVILGQTFATTPTLVYTPGPEATQTDGFSYQVSEGPVTATAVVSIGIIAFPMDPCVFNGREPGCYSPFP